MAPTIAQAQEPTTPRASCARQCDAWRREGRPPAHGAADAGWLTVADVVPRAVRLDTT